MASINNILRKYLEEVKTDIISQYNAFGMRASGNLPNQLRVFGTRSQEAVLTGPGYMRFLFTNRGRGPGAFPPVQAISDWVRDKRITFGNLSNSQMTFLVSRKIAQQGTGIYTGSRQAIDIEKILEENLPETAEEVAKFYSARYVEQLNKTIVS